MLEIVAAIYVCCGLLAAVGFVSFVVWDRWQNGTPWSWFNVGSRLFLAMLVWPLFLLAFGVLLPEFRRKPQGMANHGEPNADPGAPTG